MTNSFYPPALRTARPGPWRASRPCSVPSVPAAVTVRSIRTRLESRYEVRRIDSLQAHNLIFPCHLDSKRRIDMWRRRSVTHLSSPFSSNAFSHRVLTVIISYLYRPLMGFRGRFGFGTHTQLSPTRTSSRPPASGFHPP